MLDCKSLGYGVFTAEDVATEVQYYTEVLGLHIVSATDQRTVLATSCGAECVVVEPGEDAGINAMGFRISSNISLTETCASLNSKGIDAALATSSVTGVGDVVVFKDPNDIRVELFNAFDFVEITALHRGLDPLKLGHIAFFVPDVELLSDFYRSELGFRKSDWRDGHSTFLRCGPDHHSIPFFRGRRDLNHVAFEVRDASEVIRCADELGRRGISLEWGPGRHMIGHNISLYHRTPSGVQIELFAELDRMLDEEAGYFDPRPWHEDRPQRPKRWDVGTTAPNQWIPNAGFPPHPRQLK